MMAYNSRQKSALRSNEKRIKEKAKKLSKKQRNGSSSSSSSSNAYYCKQCLKKLLKKSSLVYILAFASSIYLFVFFRIASNDLPMHTNTIVAGQQFTKYDNKALLDNKILLDSNNKEPLSHHHKPKTIKNQYDINDVGHLLRKATENEVSTGSNAIPKHIITKKQGYTPKRPHGHGIEPELLVNHNTKRRAVQEETKDKENKAEEATNPNNIDNNNSNNNDNNSKDLYENHPNKNYVLKAYIEKIDFVDWWDTKPLPIRKTAKASELELHEFPQLNSCSKLIEQWPMQEHDFPGNHDTFLPWIHDVFPEHDGKNIQFIAQNRRRCHSGATHDERRILAWNNPQAALFQHVPVKRIGTNNTNTQGMRYKLTSHEDADKDGIATRFICRFKPSMIETLSVFNFDYDWTTLRKEYRNSFEVHDGGVKSLHTSQLLFKCPVPEELQSIIKSGTSVSEKDDFASLFVDLIPIRTPPRFGPPTQFLQPKYEKSLSSIQRKNANTFKPDIEFGNNQIIPRIEDSGRWENIPICKTSWDTYASQDSGIFNEEQKQDSIKQLETESDEKHQQGEGMDEDNNKKPIRKHRLVACVWTSAGYATRGNRFAINDGQRRLTEWINLNILTGFDHFYIFDNSKVFANNDNNNYTSVKPVTDLFGPNLTTYINWPAKICNNNPNNVDSPGERSSQYAAESSCRLRFGPHVDWIGQFDVDEYLVPMKPYDSLLPLLDKLDREKTKIISFGSWRAWPRRKFIEEPVPIYSKNECLTHNPEKAWCFQLKQPTNTTILQTYNCDRESFSNTKSKQMPAEKQLYRPDYVLLHFVHYSAVTLLSEMSKDEWKEYSNKNRKYYQKQWIEFHHRAFPDPQSRFGNELNEATMLHAKAIATSDTTDWEAACKPGYKGYSMCRIGFPHEGLIEDPEDLINNEGWKRNCYVNPNTENVWVPRLEKALQDFHKKP